LKKIILLLLKRNHKFDLKCKIKNYKNLGQTCLILLFSLLILLFSLLLINLKKNIITIEKKS